MSTDTSMEDDDDSFDSNTDAILCGTSDHSGESMISGPNIASSSSSEDDDRHQQQISTAVAGGTDDLMTLSSCASSSWFTNNYYNKQSDPQEAIMIFNVDFRALSSGVALCNNIDDNEVDNFNTEIKNFEQRVNLNYCGETVREGENEVMMKEEVRREQMVLSPLTPSSWSSFWDCEDLKGIFEVPPLSPLSPYPSFSYCDQLLVL